jgi:hypothetical protein
MATNAGGIEVIQNAIGHFKWGRWTEAWYNKWCEKEYSVFSVLCWWDVRQLVREKIPINVRRNLGTDTWEFWHLGTMDES